MATQRILFQMGYYPLFGKSGPVANGRIYIGEPGTDPEVEVNQKQVKVRSGIGGRVEVAQPIETSAGGVPTFNGSSVEMFVEGNYSMKVLDQNLEQVYYTQDSDSEIDSMESRITQNEDDIEALQGQAESGLASKVSKAGDTSTGTQSAPRFESEDGNTSISDAGIVDNSARVYSVNNTPDRGLRTFVVSLAGSTASVIRDTRSAVQSVSRPGTGRIIVTLNVAMSNAEYVINATGKRDSGGGGSHAIVSINKDSTTTTNVFELIAHDAAGTEVDLDRFYVSTWEA